ncbi:MAG: hypothetical protein IPN29_18825 [Saprospiraceae bacterium]|nr:hypothetical protein [Saprospiraceae bacterium]
MKKLIILFFCLPLFLFAQKVENDPYSRYGLGELADRSIMAYRSMGHTSIANADRFHINLANPASLAYLGTASYEVGASAKNATLKEGENKATAWSGNLEYISLGFPLKNPINEVYETSKKKYKLGMAFSLNRYSRSAYNIASIDSLDGVGIFQRSYSGSGGTYKFQWGNAIGYKSWAFGVNLGYLFGGINSTKEILFSDLENAFNNFFEKSYHIKAFTLQTGLMYNWHLNQKAAADNPSIPLRTLRFGLTYVPSTGFSTFTDELILNRQVIGTGTVVTDTITSGADIEGDGKLPDIGQQPACIHWWIYQTQL